MPYSKPESRLLFEYQTQTFPDALMWRRVRVGPFPKDHEEAVYGVLRRFPDGIVFDGSSVIIIEAKIQPNSEGLGQLLEYRKLFPETPEFSQFKDRPIRLQLVTTVLDESIKSVADSIGIEYVIFNPEWAVEELNRRKARIVSEEVG